jgi:hypothetical protein
MSDDELLLTRLRAAVAIMQEVAATATADTGPDICAANGYTDYVIFPDGQDACITKLRFTYAILAGIDRWGYERRWCYESYADALRALAEWTTRDGEDEPGGWHRDPTTGRRRPDGDPAREYVNW